MQNACSSQALSTSEIVVPDSLHTDTRIRPLGLYRWSPTDLLRTVATIIHHAPRVTSEAPRFALPTGVSSIWADRVSQAVRPVHAYQPRTDSPPTNQACVTNVLTNVPPWLAPVYKMWCP